jgi:hypothetical protein
MKSAKALNNRHLLVEKTETMKEYAVWLKEEFETKGYKINTRVAPNFLLKFYR